MPLNSTPVTTNPEALELKFASARGQLFADCGFYGGVVPGSVVHLCDLVERGVFGVKAFLIESGIDDFPAVGKEMLTRAMSVIAKSQTPLLVHAELRNGAEGLSTSPGPSSPAEAVTDYGDYLASRPGSWETAAVSLLADLALQHECPVHIVHLAEANALRIIEEARKRGAELTVETCPHYLYFDAESIESGQTLFKCAPPIRDRRNNDRLLQALLDGRIDFVATDHSPTVPDAKSLANGDFSAAWGGIASLQLRLPVIWTLVRGRGTGLNELTRWLSGRPAQFLGIGSQKGSISPGFDADLVIWDPENEFTVARDMLHDRHRLTPYEGERLFGTVKATYLRGMPVFENGQFREPLGRTLVRKID